MWCRLYTAVTSDSNRLGVKQGFTWRNEVLKGQTHRLFATANDFGGASVMSSTNESAKYFKQGDVYFCAAS